MKIKFHSAILNIFQFCGIERTPDSQNHPPKSFIPKTPYFLAQELIPGYLNGIEATYTPPKGYFVAEENPEDFAKYEAEFSYKEKLVLPGQLG